MEGIKANYLIDMKKIILYLMTFFCISCSSPKEKMALDNVLINHLLMQLIDTAAHDDLLITSQYDTTVTTGKPILVYYKTVNINQWKNEINALIKNDTSFNKFNLKWKELFEDNDEFNIELFTKKIGANKMELTEVENFSKEKYAGLLKFSSVYNAGEYSLIVVTINNGIKSGREILYLLKKTGTGLENFE